MDAGIYWKYGNIENKLLVSLYQTKLWGGKKKKKSNAKNGIAHRLWCSSLVHSPSQTDERKEDMPTFSGLGGLAEIFVKLLHSTLAVP